MRFGKPFLIAAAGILSAVFAYFGTGLHPIWWALWLAPIPVLAISFRLRGGAAFVVAAFAWGIGEMNQWNYVRHQIELPPQITILYFLVSAVVFGLGVLLVRGLVRRGSLFLRRARFALVLADVRILTAIVSPHSTWGNLAYTQMNCLAVIQIAAITGLWGISFIVFLFASAVAALLSGAGTPWQRRALAVGVGFVICAVFVFGKWRLQSNPHGQSVAVTLIAKDVPMSVYLGSEEQALRLLGEYAAEIPRVTPAETQVVVLPEKIGRIGETPWQKWILSTLRLPLRHARQLSLALFEERRLAPSIRPAITLPTANWRRIMTSIISFLVSSPKNPATNESFSMSRRDVGDCKFARTWTSPSSAANTQPKARTCCWYQPGTSFGSLAARAHGHPARGRKRFRPGSFGAQWIVNLKR